MTGKNCSNAHQNDQKFCVAFTTNDPFPITVEVVNPVNGRASQIAVDYNNLPIRCRHCLSTSHLVKDYPALKGRGTGATPESVAREGQGIQHARDRKEDGWEPNSTNRRRKGELA
jgi:hypothetical protein